MTSERTPSPAVIVCIPQQFQANEPFCCRQKMQQRHNGVMSTQAKAVRQAEEVCCTLGGN